MGSKIKMIYKKCIIYILYKLILIILNNFILKNIKNINNFFYIS